MRLNSPAQQAEEQEGRCSCGCQTSDDDEGYEEGYSAEERSAVSPEESFEKFMEGWRQFEEGWGKASLQPRLQLVLFCLALPLLLVCGLRWLGDGSAFEGARRKVPACGSTLHVVHQHPVYILQPLVCPASSRALQACAFASISHGALSPVGCSGVSVRA